MRKCALGSESWNVALGREVALGWELLWGGKIINEYENA